MRSRLRTRLLSRLEGDRGLARFALRDVFGLTAAETRVAALIGEGLSVPAVAAALDLSEYTVKTHLGGCFHKIGARSQAELARLLGAMPASW